MMLRALAALFLAAGSGDAIDPARYTRALFEDAFDGPSLGKSWKSYKSASTIRDGVLVGIEPPDAGHNSVNSIDVPPVGDLMVDLRFKFAGAKRFAIAFNDRLYKGAHAGHICRVTFDGASVTYQDDRDGVFKNEIYEKKKAGGQVDPALLKDRTLKLPAQFEEGRWYAVSLRIQGDLMQVQLDGRPQGEFRSSGVGHVEKRNVALVVSGRELHVDDLKVRAAP
jgi:hypothetical protein